MTNVFGTNLVTVSADAITTGQTQTAHDASDNSVHITTETGPLTHGIFLVIDGGNFYVGIDDGTSAYNAGSDISALGVKVSSNNPLFIPIKDPSKVVICSTVAEKTMTYICY